MHEVPRFVGHAPRPDNDNGNPTSDMVSAKAIGRPSETLADLRMRAASLSGLSADLAERVLDMIDRGEDLPRLPNGTVSWRAASSLLGIRLDKKQANPVSLLFRDFLLHFEETSRPAPRPVQSRVDRAKVIDRVRRYIAERAVDGATIPAAPRGMISIYGVAADLGLEYAELRRNQRALTALTTALKTGQLRLGDVYKVTHCLDREELRRRRQSILRVIYSFDVPGGKIPESRRRRLTPDYEHIALLTGEEGPTLERDAAVRKAIREVAMRRGYEMPGVQVSSTSFASFLQVGMELEGDLKKDSATASQVIANLKSAMSKIMKHLEVSGEDEVGDTFGAGYEAVVTTILAGIGNAGTAGSVRRNLRRWKEIWELHRNAAGLPNRFGDALQTLLDRNGVYRQRLAEHIGVSKTTMHDWLNNKKRPSFGSMDKVAAIEEFFAVPAGTLGGLCEFGIKLRLTIPDATSAYRNLTSQIRAQLPDEAAYWEPEILSSAVEAVRPLLGRSTPFGTKLSAAFSLEYRLPVFEPSERLLNELSQHAAYKTNDFVYPMQRSKNGKWRSASTEAMGTSALMQFFRLVTAPVTSGGLGLPASKATLAWLAVPAIVFGYVTADCQRLKEVEHDGKSVSSTFHNGHYNFVGTTLHMTDPVTGWLSQSGDMADALSALPFIPEHILSTMPSELNVKGERRRFMDEASVRTYRADWRTSCESAHVFYKGFLTHVRSTFEFSRNPFLPVAGILENEAPLARLVECIIASRDRWRSASASPLLHFCDVRETAGVLLETVLAFRPKNHLALTYRKDNEGRLRRDGGKWVVWSPYGEFKNWQNAEIFGPPGKKRDFFRALPDQFGLYDLLDYYTGMLPSFRQEGVDALFVTRSGELARGHDLWTMFNRFGQRNVAYNPVLQTGVPGVLSFYPYACRHIVATHTMKNSRSPNPTREAAMRLQTSEAMIFKHYGHLLPEDVLKDGDVTYGDLAITVAKEIKI